MVLDLSKLGKASIDSPPDLMRGVDLNIVRNKKKHQHRWAALATFLTSDDQLTEIMRQVDEAREDASRKKALGEEPTPVPIPIPLSHDQLVNVEGPGCIKCGQHWMQPEKGYGKLCDVSDDDFEQQQ